MRPRSARQAQRPLATQPLASKSRQLSARHVAECFAILCQNMSARARRSNSLVVKKNTMSMGTRVPWNCVIFTFSGGAFMKKFMGFMISKAAGFCDQ